jgi:hypothetical protein
MRGFSLSRDDCLAIREKVKDPKFDLQCARNAGISTFIPAGHSRAEGNPVLMLMDSCLRRNDNQLGTAVLARQPFLDVRICSRPEAGYRYG